MIGFLNSLFTFLSSFIKILEKLRVKKQVKSEYEFRNKASAYEKLQKAVRARNSASISSSSDDIMSEDRFKRRE